MRMIILAIVALTTAEMTASVSAGPVPENCMSCICSVESGCQMPSPLCHNDGGSQSCGPYQIKNTYWQDARRKGGYLEGDWRRCAASFTCSEDAVQGYMERYATLGRLGHNATCEDFARLHNGGLYGFQYSSTIGYWNRVQSCLNG